MSNAVTAGTLIRLLERKNPAAADLARLASIAVRIEPELLRALRLDLLSGADVSAEADLWLDDIIATRTPRAVTLLPEVAAALRRDLPARIEGARAIVERLHAGAPQILRLEEALIWSALTGDVAAIEASLLEVLAAMLGDEARRDNLAAWALRALPRLPERAREKPAFWMLLFAASGAGKGGAIALEGDPPPLSQVAMDPAIFRGMKPVHVEVQRWGDVLRLRHGAEEKAAGASIAVPGTRPIVLEVRSALAARVLTLKVEGWTEVPVSGDEARILALDGQRYVLRSTPADVAEPSPKAADDLWRGCARIHASESGSGYLVASDLVATAAHLFRERRDRGIPTTEMAAIVEIGGLRCQATLLRIDRDADCAILQLDAPILGVVPYELSSSFVKGHAWVAYGFPLESDARGLTVSGQIGEIVHGGPGEIVLYQSTYPLLSGMSGAPVFFNGHVIGHLTKTLELQGNPLLACRAARVFELLQAIQRGTAALATLAAIAARHEEQLRSTEGPEGQLVEVMARLGEATVSAQEAEMTWPAIRRLLESDRVGERFVALAALAGRPYPDGLDLVMRVLKESRSAFEQLAALHALRGIVPLLSPGHLADVRALLVASVDLRDRMVPPLVHEALASSVRAVLDGIAARTDSRLPTIERPPPAEVQWLVAVKPSDVARDALKQFFSMRGVDTPVWIIQDAAIHPDRLVVQSTRAAMETFFAARRANELTELGDQRIRWAAEPTPPRDLDDPQKGRWGGLPERDGRILTAMVTREDDSDFQVRLRVGPTQGAKPLAGPVVFHLHPTFPNQTRKVEPVRGRASLRLWAWGSFTVGAEADGGQVHLELDLGQLPGLPAGFLDEARPRSPASKRAAAKVAKRPVVKTAKKAGKVAKKPAVKTAKKAGKVAKKPALKTAKKAGKVAKKSAVKTAKSAKS